MLRSGTARRVRRSSAKARRGPAVRPHVTRAFTVPALVNISGTPPARADGNYGYPVAAVRLKVTAYTAGSATLTALQGFGS
jgi:hypothetical protein